MLNLTILLQLGRGNFFLEKVENFEILWHKSSCMAKFCYRFLDLPFLDFQFVLQLLNEVFQTLRALLIFLDL